ncbi:MAG TPA: TetR/AcrR family transcriptional regulator [Aeromonadales bacterium]|nr:TetR/AcrR family transcriptional regulator [Aeromonadales bacterium]
MTEKTKAKKTINRKPTFTEQARKKQILEISLDLFIKKGFEQTSIADIAAAAGVSRGVIFYYFEGKGELGEEVIRQSLKEYGRYVQLRVNRKSSAIDKLLEFVDACLDYTDEHHDNWLVYVNTIGRFGNNNEKNNLLAWMSERTQENLITLILQGQEDGEIEDYPAQELSYILQGVVDGLMSLVAIQPDKLDVLACKKLLKSILLKILKMK